MAAQGTFRCDDGHQEDVAPVDGDEEVVRRRDHRRNVTQAG